MAAEEVGIRELRQNLSVYVARVKKGERFVVTEHNRPVAELVPTKKRAEVTGEETWEELVARVGIIEATKPPVFPEPLPYPPDYKGPPASEILIRSRRRERF
jgi:prevent-host-death family protein